MCRKNRLRCHTRYNQKCVVDCLPNSEGSGVQGIRSKAGKHLHSTNNKKQGSIATIDLKTAS